MFRRFLKPMAIFVVIILTSAFFPLTVLAEETLAVSDYNAIVLEKELALEKKYGIQIEYPHYANGYAGIGVQSLTTLDTCLGYVTVEVVSALSEYYRQINGTPLTIVYTHSRNFADDAVAAFSPTQSIIYVYTPGGGNYLYPETGNGPIPIIHELGHALHGYLDYKEGADSLKRQWTKLNAGGGANTYISAYAATDYFEDFAETFAHAFVCNRAGCSISKFLKTSAGTLTPIGEKVELIKKMMSAYLPDSAQAIKNIDMAFTTAEFISYRGLNLTGTALEYIGYSEPFAIVKAIVRYMPFEATAYQWEKSVGGWVMQAANGREYIVFPAGLYREIQVPAQRQAA